MRETSRRGDRITLLAFAFFWVVIAFGGWLGYTLVQASGGSKSSTTSTGAVLHRTAQSAATTAPPPLTIASVFAAQPPSLARYGVQNLRTLIATGDVIPARSVNYKMVTYNDFLYPFRRTAGYLRSGDLTLINLESPLIANGCPVVYEGMQFCGDPRFVQGLRFAGVDTACTANNHIGNYGPQGIQETWNHLGAAGIGYCGYGKVDHKTVRGITFAFLAYNTVGERFNYALARQQIRAARRGADIVIVSVHWGKEYVAVPTVAPGIADDDPQKVAHWIIDSGADLIIGNHPHHVQAVEIYHQHFISYAHGNFAFDQMFSMPTREGVVGKYTFYRKRLVAVQYRPVVIYDYAQPRWADPATAHQILNGMRDATLQLAQRKG